MSSVTSTPFRMRQVVVALREERGVRVAVASRNSAIADSDAAAIRSQRSQRGPGRGLTAA
jgi:hypothetical protein